MLTSHIDYNSSKNLEILGNSPIPTPNKTHEPNPHNRVNSFSKGAFANKAINPETINNIEKIIAFLFLETVCFPLINEKR